MLRCLCRLNLVGTLLFVPALAFAQASITGVVRDASGAVLPGVTVEVTSPALIEKVRSATTDGTGQYKIEQLRPGTYAVVFSLPGFSTVKREGIELSGTFAATINADLRVGTVEETVTVTGESPVVDVQSARQERVLDADVLNALPTGRTLQTTAVLLPALTINNSNVGGTNTASFASNGAGTIHGSDASSGRVMIDGISIASGDTAGQSSNFLPDFGSAQEVVVGLASGTAEQGVGGVQINMIPREGGNAYHGSLFGTGVNSSFQGSNFTPDLQARGLRTPDRIKKTWNFNVSVGGPVKRDRLWFFSSFQGVRNENYIGGMFDNKNRGNPNVWTYVPGDPSVASSFQRSVNVRLTWQATPKNKFSFYADEQWRCQCYLVTPLTTPEGSAYWRYPAQRMQSVAWTSTPTSRLLLEARLGFRRESYSNIPQMSADDPYFDLIPVLEQGGLIPGLQYRSYGAAPSGITAVMRTTTSNPIPHSASLSYVTGSHASKFGFTNVRSSRDAFETDNDARISYRFRDGIPNQLTQRSTPYSYGMRQPFDLGIYAQDKWTLHRLTLTGGVRYDYFESYAPEVQLGPALLTPTRNLLLPETPMLHFHDVVPRMAATYDVFGNAKTAVRTTLNKFVNGLGIQVGSMNGNLDPFSSLANNVTRSWVDNDRDFVVDCDLANVNSQGPTLTGALQAIDACGVVSDTNFGKPTFSTRSDPRALGGWSTRPYQWEFSAGVQHEVVPRVSATVGYFRRWFGNFTVVDNLNLAGSDFSPFSVTAPADVRLPDGGGNTISPFYDRNPDVVTRPPDNYNTLASDYGKQIQHWNGVDVTVDLRAKGGLTLLGGLSTGRQTTDNCEVLAKVPDASPLGLPYCHQQQPFLTQYKFLGTYTIPRVDVQLSSTLQSFPGPMLSGNYVVSNAQVRPSLGRDLSAGAQNVTVNIVHPNSLFGERYNQLDLRFAKLLRFGSTTTALNLDVYNALNTDAALTENPNYINSTLQGWRVPTSIAPARFAKISVQFDF